jgi:hypothetical protein
MVYRPVYREKVNPALRTSGGGAPPDPECSARGGNVQPHGVTRPGCGELLQPHTGSGGVQSRGELLLGAGGFGARSGVGCQLEV